MEKTDLKKELKELYLPSAKKVSVVDVPEMNFVMIDGTGDPNTAGSFQEAIGVLYGLSYTAKFMIKAREREDDFVVPPLEGLWWLEGVEGFNFERRDDWRWTMMIVQPKPVTRKVFEKARSELERKKNPPRLSEARFESFHEGLCVQIMHIGPYSEERPNIEKMHRFAEENGYKLRGKHHEIYLGDPRRTKPERLKTVLRQPVG